MTSAMDQSSNKELNTLLLEAVNNEDIEKVEELISEGANINAAERVLGTYSCNAITPLCLAVEKKNAELVRTLLNSSDIDVNQKDYYGNIALHEACSNGNLEVVEALLATKKVHVNTGCKKYGITPLHIASMRCFDEIVEALLKYPGILVNQQDKSGKTPLHHPASDGYTEVVEILLKVPEILVNVQDELHGHTPLHLATDFRHEDTVEVLLNHPEIDVNIQDKYGQTALHTSAYHGDLKVVEMLLEAGIDASKKNTQGETAIFWASKQRHQAVVEKIINHMKNVEASGGTYVRRSRNVGDQLIKQEAVKDSSRKGNDPNNQLLSAAKNNDLGKVEELLKQPGIDINSTDKYKNTPLHFASEKGYIEMVRVLLKNEDIDVNAKNQDKSKLAYPVHPGDDPKRKMLDIGKTPLYLAVDAGHLEVVKILLDHPKIDVNAKDKYSVFPLWVAVENGDEDIVEALLSHKSIDVNAKYICNDHYNSLHNATEKGKIKIVKMLLSNPDINVNTQDMYNESTPLHMAVKRNNLETVQALLNNPKVNLNIKEKFNNTALEIAEEKHFTDIVKLLKEAHENKKAREISGKNAK